MLIRLGGTNSGVRAQSASRGLSMSRGAPKTVVVNGTPQKYHRGLTKKNGSRDRAMELMIRDGGLGV